MFAILFALVVFGIWTSYTDIKKGMIRNNVILLLLLAAFILNTFYTRSFVVATAASAVNITVAIVGGFLLWFAGMWSAADAKLFIGFAFLLPITLYEHSFSYFPAVAILINSFVPIFLILFINLVLKTNSKDIKKAVREQLNIKSVLRLALAVFAISFIPMVMRYVFNIQFEYFTSILFLFIIFEVVEKTIKVKMNVFYIIMSIAYVIFFNSYIFTLDFIFNFIRWFLMLLGIFFLINLSRFSFTSSVKITELKEGMIPAEIIVKSSEKYVTRPMAFITPFSMLRQRKESIFGYNPDGLVGKDIKNIQSLYREKKLGFDEIRVSNTMPFAPILFIGALITYFSSGIFLNLFI
ncbi:MAG: A24 family peptidase C-terminal domain-containing protein [Candidatus Aenigmatarchaeota archaeon]